MTRVNSDRRHPDATPREHTPIRDLTTGSIPRHLVVFALPLLAGSVLQSAYSIINAFWVGNFLPTAALAAVTVSFPIVFLLIAVGGGFTLATNILIAQYAGGRDMDGVQRVMRNSYALVGFISLVLLAVGLFSAEGLLRLVGTPADVLPMATGYLRIYLLSLPTGFGLFLVSSILRGLGDSKTPLYFQAVALALAAALDPVLMLGLGGFPRLGLNGTAVAAVIGQFAALASLLLYLLRKRHLAAENLRRPGLDAATTRLIVLIGLPIVVQQSLMSVGMLFLVGLVNVFGEKATAAFGAGLRIDQVAFLPAMSIGMAVSTLTGQNIGADKYHRVGRVFWWGQLVSIGLTLPVALLAFGIPEVLIQAFIRDAEVVAIGSTYLRIMAVTYVLFAVLFVSNGVINGAGHTFATTIISLLALWIIRVPLAALLSQFPMVDGRLVVTVGEWVWRLPVPTAATGIVARMEGIWYAMVISVAISAVISLLYYFSGRWKRKIVNDRTRPPRAEPGEEDAAA